MSTKINDGGPAFPAPAGVSHITSQGMTLRDWFAGQALAGCIDACQSGKIAAPGPEATAQVAYQYADAMLLAREAKRP